MLSTVLLLALATSSGARVGHEVATAPTPVSPGATAPRSWRLPLSVAVFNQSYALPLRDVGRTTPLHPGIVLGTELRLTRGRFGELALAGELGGFRSPPLQNAVFFNSDLLYRYVAPYGPFGTLLLGPGYLHSTSTRPVYERHDGRYRRATDWGSSHLLLSVGVGVGYDFGETTTVPLQVFLRYRFFLQLPGFIGADALPNACVQLGARYEFGGDR